MATFNTELSRKGPGLLLRDILAGDAPQISAVIEIIKAGNADVLVLQGLDYDLEQATLNAFVGALAQSGQPYAHVFSAPPNAGRPTALDLDGDGKLGGPGDAQGYGRFYGQGGMALLSRFPILQDEVQDFTSLLWKDLPDALLPFTDAGPFPSAEALEIQRLASNGIWAVPISHPDLGKVSILTFDAGPPVFDGPEDRNGKRNHDEIMFWTHYLRGTFGRAPEKRFVLTGNANLDPDRGEGRRTAIQTLLNHPLLQAPLPGVPTVNWETAGQLRVDYVLPSADWRVVDVYVSPFEPTASRHALVWVDLVLDPINASR